MFAGAALAAQFAAIDRRLLSHEKDIDELKNKVDFFVQTQTPPLQGVFYNGQFWDARALEKCCQCENVANCQFQFPIEEAA